MNDFSHTSKHTPPETFTSVAKSERGVFALVWVYKELPKVHRHSLGKRIDDLFVVSIEMIVQASFTRSEKKLLYIQTAIRKIDTLKILLLVLWETKSLDNKKYLALSVKIDEIGRMLGGWSGQVEKKNSPR